MIPGAALPQWRWADLLSIDKLVHASLFFGQSLLLARLFLGHGRPQRWLLWAVVISASYGSGVELMQGLEALGRRTDLNDAIANTVGACAAAWFAQRRVAKGKTLIPLALLR
ncbi:MAG TPA: VanZ family protein [Flavobacteriales bacterium]|nr:VanZ family protein [Flavobacteriales bacterium]